MLNVTNMKRKSGRGKHFFTAMEIVALVIAGMFLKCSEPVMMYQSAPSRWPSDNTSVSVIACLKVNEIRGKLPLSNPEVITLKKW